MRNGSSMQRKGGRVGGRKLPLVSELETGQDGQGYFGARWLKPEICKPCSASCFLFSVSSARCSVCVQDNMTGGWRDREVL